MLPRAFYLQDALSLARALIGKRLVHIGADGVRTSGIITETEAYLGEQDDASHTYKGRSERTRIAWEDTGRAYVYLIYGMHCCFNITCAADGVPHMVLVRALQPETGLEAMKARRAADGMLNLCSGPGKLCKAMGIDRSLYGERLWESRRLFVEDTLHTPPVLATPRIGIDYAERSKHEPWRFVWAGSEYLSRPWKKELQLLQQTEQEKRK